MTGIGVDSSDISQTCGCYSLGEGGQCGLLHGASRLENCPIIGIAGHLGFELSLILLYRHFLVQPAPPYPLTAVVLLHSLIFVLLYHHMLVQPELPHRPTVVEPTVIDSLNTCVTATVFLTATIAMLCNVTSSYTYATCTATSSHNCATCPATRPLIWSVLLSPPHSCLALYWSSWSMLCTGRSDTDCRRRTDTRCCPCPHSSRW